MSDDTRRTIALRPGSRRFVHETMVGALPLTRLPTTIVPPPQYIATCISYRGEQRRERCSCGRYDLDWTPLDGD